MAALPLSAPSDPNTATRKVYDILLTQLRALRSSPDSKLRQAAAEFERELLTRLSRLTRTAVESETQADPA